MKRKARSTQQSALHTRRPFEKTKRDKENRLIVEQEDRLLNFLLQHIHHKSRNAIKAALTRGQVTVNGRVTTRYDHPLQPGQTVAVSWTPKPEPVPLIGLSIQYEDEHVLVVHKDAGLLTIATANPGYDELTAYRQLTEYVRNNDPTGRIFIVHRLDRDTSGLIVFAKTEEAKRRLQENWHDMVRKRTYVAVVEGQVKRAEGTITSWLKETKTLFVYSSQVQGDGQPAVTHYKVLVSNRDYSLLEVELETGRKHQIRVHMQDIGHPVVGDKKYGSRQDPLGRLCLHARMLAFTHPITGKAMRFESKIPAAFWRLFREEEHEPKR